MLTMVQFVNDRGAVYRAIPVHLFCAAETAEKEIKGFALNLISLSQR